MTSPKTAIVSPALERARISSISLDISLSLSLNIRNHHPDVPDNALSSLDDLGRALAFRAFENGGDLVKGVVAHRDVAIVPASALDPAPEVLAIEGGGGQDGLLCS